MSSQSRGFLASPEGLKLLQAAQAERGLTYGAIAEQAGVTVYTVCRLLDGWWGDLVSGESVRVIAEVLGLEVDAIALAEANPGPLAEAERRIQHAWENGVTVLDLSRLWLTVLPESIGQLTNLTELFLDIAADY